MEELHKALLSVPEVNVKAEAFLQIRVTPYGLGGLPVNDALPVQALFVKYGHFFLSELLSFFSATSM